jgi:hypothetical protein
VSAAAFVVRRLRRTPARETVAPPPRTRVLISPRRGSDGSTGTIEWVECRDGLIDVMVKLGDGSRGLATLYDDDVSSLELEVADTVFVRAV